MNKLLTPYTSKNSRSYYLDISFIRPYNVKLFVKHISFPEIEEYNRFLISIMPADLY